MYIRKNIKSVFAIVSCVVILISCVSFVSAAQEITYCLNLLSVNQNTAGNGYTWDNINQTLTINGLNIDTSDEFGIKLPSDATVIVDGNCSIVSRGTALYVEGNVTFRGNGTLTLSGSSYGLVNNSSKTTDKTTITEATLKIAGGTNAIRSDNAKVQISGASVRLSSNEGDAIFARAVVVSDIANVSADSSLHASHFLSISDSEINVSSKSSALVSDEQLSIKNVDISVGKDKNNFSSAEKYNGENAIKTKPNSLHSKKSILFGDKYSLSIDFIVLLTVFIFLAAIIVLPIINHKKKVDKFKNINKK